MKTFALDAYMHINVEECFFKYTSRITYKYAYGIPTRDIGYLYSFTLNTQRICYSREISACLIGITILYCAPKFIYKLIVSIFLRILLGFCVFKHEERI